MPRRMVAPRASTEYKALKSGTGIEAKLGAIPNHRGHQTVVRLEDSLPSISTDARSLIRRRAHQLVFSPASQLGTNQRENISSIKSPTVTTSSLPRHEPLPPTTFAEPPIGLILNTIETVEVAQVDPQCQRRDAARGLYARLHALPPLPFSSLAQHFSSSLLIEALEIARKAGHSRVIDTLLRALPYYFSDQDLAGNWTIFCALARARFVPGVLELLRREIQRLLDLVDLSGNHCISCFWMGTIRNDSPQRVLVNPKTWSAAGLMDVPLALVQALLEVQGKYRFKRVRDPRRFAADVVDLWGEYERPSAAVRDQKV